MNLPTARLSGSLLGLQDDVSRVADFNWAVWDCGARTYLFVSGASNPPEGVDEVNGAGWVVQIWRECPLLNNFSSVSPDSFPAMTSAVADVVQTTVMDELNRGWPELRENSRFVGILGPETDSEGQLWWSLRGTRLCVAGQLDSLDIG